MDAQDALIGLLSHSLARRRDRYVWLASHPRAHEKLLRELYHQFSGCLAPRCLAVELPEAA